MPYSWTSDDDEIAWDAIIVGIGDDSPALIAAGMTPAEPLANIYWPDWISQGDKINASMEGPYPVHEALERAEVLCELWAYKRVVISLQDRATWRREWVSFVKWKVSIERGPYERLEQATAASFKASLQGNVFLGNCR